MIPAHCGIKGNEQADRLAKQGSNMKQEKLPITLKQKKTVIKNRFRAKKIPDDYHQLDRAGQVTLIRNLSTYWSQQTQFTHAQKDESSTITTTYMRNRRSNNRTHTAKMSSIPSSQTTDMVRRNIITPEAVWEQRRTREDSWLHSAGWLICVIKRMRRRRRRRRRDF